MVGYDEKKIELTAQEYAFAGAAAGIITRFLFQPLDVLKIRFQLQVEPLKRSSDISKYRTLLQASSTILKEEGIKGLWRGHNSGQLLSITYGVVQFSTFETLTEYSEKVFSSHRSLNSHFICGAVAGTLATIASFPFDVTRTRFVAQGNYQAYRKMWEGMVLIVTKEGPTALFKGLTPTLIQVAPQSGVTFLTHNVISRLIQNFSWVSKQSEGSELKVSGNLIAGSVSGLVAKVAVYPFDLAKKRLQLQGFQDARRGFGENFTCRGLINCLFRTMKNEGFTALFKGLVPSMIKASVTTGMYFTVYDETCKILATVKH
uniref:Mitochondrial thiamine pyrophosphate carrier n=2 Tax=Triatoma infestans TaxID=30076 RepID=A0A023F057_TRIIF